MMIGTSRTRLTRPTPIKGILRCGAAPRWESHVGPSTGRVRMSGGIGWPGIALVLRWRGVAVSFSELLAVLPPNHLEAGRFEALDPHLMEEKWEPRRLTAPYVEPVPLNWGMDVLHFRCVEERSYASRLLELTADMPPRGWTAVCSA
jgi:hypothetical protein